MRLHPADDEAAPNDLHTCSMRTITDFRGNARSYEIAHFPANESKGGFNGRRKKMNRILHRYARSSNRLFLELLPFENNVEIIRYIINTD